MPPRRCKAASAAVDCRDLPQRKPHGRDCGRRHRARADGGNARTALSSVFFDQAARNRSGLSIAAKIIQEHQGAIRAEQNVPQGARFVVELPLVESPALNTSGGVVVVSNGSHDGRSNGHSANGYAPKGQMPANGNGSAADHDTKVPELSLLPYRLATILPHEPRPDHR